MAIEGGEVEGFFNSWTSLKITSFDKIKNGEWLLLAQLAERPIKDLIVPNVPTIPMITKTTEQNLLLKYGTSTPNDFGKVYVLPRVHRRTGQRHWRTPLRRYLQTRSWWLTLKRAS